VSLLRLAVLSVALCVSCESSLREWGAPSGLYHWGGYEDSVYEVCREFPESGPDQQAASLAADIARAAARGWPVPPGAHAHLGYLLYLAGDWPGAREHLLAEKQLFPESAAFIDVLLARMES